MKKILTISMLALAGLLFSNFGCFDSPILTNGSSADEIEIPEDVQAVIDQSCFACHNSESQNEKGRDKLSFDDLSSLQTFKLMGVFEGIEKVIESEDMPPKKFLSKYPDRALSEDNKEVLLSWVQDEADRLGNDKE